MSQITDITILKNYTRVSNDFTVDLLVPFEKIAFTSYINTFFQKDLQDAVFALSTESIGSEGNQMYDALMFALVNFTMYEYSNQGEITVSDNGILRTEGDSVKTAFAGQIKKYQASLIDTAYSNVGVLIDLLEKTDVSELTDLWLESPAYSNRSALLVKSAFEFNSIQRLYRYQTTFIDLIPIAKNVQDLYLVPAIGETLFNEIVVNDTGMDANKKIARNYLITALVNITMANALKTGMVKLTPAGVITIGQDKDTSYQLEEKGMPEHVSVPHTHYMDTGLRFVDRAKQHLISSLIITATTSTPKRFRV